MMPDYLVIGAQKCATSSLCSLLGAHPEVFMTNPKEPFFFSHDEIWKRGMGWYQSLFERVTDEKAVGEGSTTYSMYETYPDAARRIAENLPEVKLIYIVRDPLDRIVSHWVHLRSSGGREKLPFRDAVRTEPAYIDNSLYEKQIGIYLEHYPPDRIMTLFFEDFVRDQAATMARCFDFLGVDTSLASPHTRHKHGSAGKREDTRLLRPLRRFRFFEILRDRAPHWLREPLRRALKRRAERPLFDAETRDWVAGRLREDSRAFLARSGKPTGFWGL
jgi:hypothetical protein